MGIKGSIYSDFCMSLFFPICTVAQEWRETMKLAPYGPSEDDPSEEIWQKKYDPSKGIWNIKYQGSVCKDAK